MNNEYFVFVQCTHSVASHGLFWQAAAPLKQPAPAPTTEAEGRGIPRRVVYVPSCVTRMMGPARGDYETQAVHEKVLSLMHKAGYEVVYPKVRVDHCFDQQC